MYFAAGCFSACTLSGGLVVFIVFGVPAIVGSGGFVGPPSAPHPEAPPWTNYSAASTSITLKWGTPNMHGHSLVKYTVQTDRGRATGDFATECDGSR